MKTQLLSSLALLSRANGFSSSLTTRSSTLVTGRGPIRTISFATVERELVSDDAPAAKFLDDAISPDLLGTPIPYSELTIGVMKETFPGENRVSQTPDSVHLLVKEGFTVVVERGGTFVFVLRIYG
jgi:Alanine dehydrogenase/PNT, N-terminal domain